MNNIEVKEIRTKLGVTQREFAVMVGVDTKTIQNWEAGRKIPASKHAILRGMLPKSHVVYGGQHVEDGDAINGDKFVEQVTEKTQEEATEETIIKNEDDVTKTDLLALLHAKQKSLDDLIAQQDRYLTIIESLTQKI